MSRVSRTLHSKCARMFTYPPVYANGLFCFRHIQLARNSRKGDHQSFRGPSQHSRRFRGTAFHAGCQGSFVQPWSDQGNITRISFRKVSCSRCPSVLSTFGSQCSRYVGVSSSLEKPIFQAPWDTLSTRPGLVEGREFRSSEVLGTSNNLEFHLFESTLSTVLSALATL